ncbi:MAG: hypothetical protein K2X03_31145 [Bryobacteraceae bacterium]|nr:hypothetical protein [Bryobacteraceae bacterium]
MAISGCSLRLFHREGAYYVAIDHPGVAAELATRWHALPPLTEPIPPPGFHNFIVPDTAPLQGLIREIYHLVRALPSEPLRQFEEATRTLPRSTEAERLIIQRVGQNVFREALDLYWGHRCAVTQVTQRPLVRASHIKPWGFSGDAERLDVYNGLLAAPLDRAGLGVHPGLQLQHLSPAHLPYHAWHREHLFEGAAEGSRP